MKRTAFPLIDYEKKLISPGKFIAPNLLLLKRYKNGREIIIDTSHKNYITVIRFPITTSEEEQRKLLQKANALSKSLVAETIFGSDGKLKYRPYGAIRSDTKRKEKENIRLMRRYYELKNKSSELKDHACFLKISEEFKISFGSARQRIRRTKKRYSYLQIPGPR